MTNANLHLLGTSICYRHKSSKHNEPITWKQGKIIGGKQHILEIVNNKDREFSATYENIRIRLRHKLVKGFAFGNVESYIELLSTQQFDFDNVENPVFIKKTYLIASSNEQDLQ